MQKPLKAVLVTSMFVLFLVSVVSAQVLKIDYEKYTLENGLDVILHEDKSDPIVSVAIQYHVGSNREEKGRTGFAHLFEHMLFQESQHIGQDQFFTKIQDAGGTLNGGTWTDGTVYYEVVPKNALEMVLWMESDRMGFLLSTVTQEAFENQQGVVQNEKRQGVDNRPYGHTSYIIDKLLYPEDHPYNWQVIGEMEDLRNATLKDVHNFHKKWYGPNNATLVIAGDFEESQTKEWIEKYFGEIESSDPVSNLDPQPVSLSETKRAYYEDEFANSPELNMVFPTIQQFHKDAYALQYFGQLFSGTKKAPLYKIIVEEKKLAPSVSSYQSSSEIAGVFQIRIQSFPNVNLTDVETAIHEAFARFEEEGFTEKDVERIKAQLETSFYNGISSILSKSFQLSQYNEYAGSPGFIETDLQNYLQVTMDDIWRVYNTYIKGKHYVLTSVVPKTKLDLVAENSTQFPVVIESLEEQNVVSSGEKADITVEPIPSNFDRNIEPPKGPDPLLTIPEVWQDTLSNGMAIIGIEQRELPLIQFSISIRGGQLGERIDKPAIGDLLCDLMMEGTKNKTPIELEEAIDELGASIYFNIGDEQIRLYANMLASKSEETMKLVEEILLEPRWDEKEFERLKKELIETMNRYDAMASVTASSVFDMLVNDKKNIFAFTYNGNKDSVEATTMDDLKKYYETYFSPNVTYIAIVGDISKDEAVRMFSGLEEKWQPKEVVIPSVEMPPVPDRARLYFVDFPGAKQSEIRIGYPLLKYTNPDYFPVTVMNYKLGGSFNGIVNLILREEKGYTYGARTSLWGALNSGCFYASAAVQSTATRESVQIFKDEMTKYRQGISEEDIAFTKNSLIKSNSRRFETLGVLLGMINEIDRFKLPIDYIKQQEDFIRGLTLEKHRELAQKYINPDKMIYLVVGDAKTQLESLSELGLGEPILLDKYADPIENN